MRPAAMPIFMAISGVMGNELARPRTPSVPKYLRVIVCYPYPPRRIANFRPAFITKTEPTQHITIGYGLFPAENTEIPSFRGAGAWVRMKSAPLPRAKSSAARLAGPASAGDRPVTLRRKDLRDTEIRTGRPK